ncbi:MAG: riboflavin synthase subunit alpha [Cyanobacteria bacterium P01_H01_bin.15]
MLVLSIFSLVVATVATLGSLKTQEDVVRPVLGVIAVLAIVVTLCCAPWVMKLSLLALPFVLETLVDWYPGS